MGEGGVPRHAGHQAITDIVWKWTESLDSSGKTTTVSKPETYTIELKSDGTIAIRADCTTGGGSYQLNANQLTVTLDAMTLVGCPAGSLDRRYLNERGQAASYFSMARTCPQTES